MTSVTMTTEQLAGPGYAQHMITVDRDGPEWEGIIGCLFLTSGEIGQLACLIQNHRDGEATGAGTVTIRFEDTTGRPADG